MRSPFSSRRACSASGNSRTVQSLVGYLLELQLDGVFDGVTIPLGTPRNDPPSLHDPANVGQRCNIVEGVVVDKDEIGQFAWLDGSKIFLMT